MRNKVVLGAVDDKSSKQRVLGRQRDPSEVGVLGGCPSKLLLLNSRPANSALNSSKSETRGAYRLVAHSPHGGLRKAGAADTGL
jgi:hypothetical protein